MIILIVMIIMKTMKHDDNMIIKTCRKYIRTKNTLKSLSETKIQPNKKCNDSPSKSRQNSP